MVFTEVINSSSHVEKLKVCEEIGANLKVLVGFKEVFVVIEGDLNGIFETCDDGTWWYVLRLKKIDFALNFNYFHIFNLFNVIFDAIVDAGQYLNENSCHVEKTRSLWVIPRVNEPHRWNI